MAEKVQKVGVKREHNYLYFIDEDGDISRSLMSNNSKGEPEKIAVVGIKKEVGFLYFIDKDGDISRSAMRRAQAENKIPTAESLWLETTRERAKKQRSELSELRKIADFYKNELESVASLEKEIREIPVIRITLSETEQESKKEMLALKKRVKAFEDLIKVFSGKIVRNIKEQAAIINILSSLEERMSDLEESIYEPNEDDETEDYEEE